MSKEQLVAYFGLPREVKFCHRCVISNQRPSSTVEFAHTRQDKKQVIGFDENNVCSACRYQEVKANQIDWGRREESLVKLLDQHRSSDGAYDVIVPGSGGKDSAYTAHILKYKYGMNPLTVTWAPHLYTDIGWKNMQEWMHTGGLDNILYTPNGILHQEMTKNAFHNLLHFSTFRFSRCFRLFLLLLLFFIFWSLLFWLQRLIDILCSFIGFTIRINRSLRFMSFSRFRLFF